jgi:hypothetical protein
LNSPFVLCSSNHLVSGVLGRLFDRGRWWVGFQYGQNVWWFNCVVFLVWLLSMNVFVNFYHHWRKICVLTVKQIFILMHVWYVASVLYRKQQYVTSFQLYCKTAATILCNHIRPMKGSRTVQDHTPVQPNHYKTEYYVIAMIYWL